MTVFISREPPRPPQWPPRPGPGQAGWGSSWLAQSSPDPAIPVCRRRRKWQILPWPNSSKSRPKTSLALPARGAWGGSVYEEYKLVPCSSRPAGVVTRCSGPTPGARELESSSIVQPSPCREHPRARPRRPCVRWKRGGGGTSRGHRDRLRTSPCSDRPVSACRLAPPGRSEQ